MNRRKFIAGIGIPLVSLTAACVTEDSADETFTDSKHGVISIESVDSLPEQSRLDAGVDIENNSFNGSNPPQLQITMENVGDTRLQTSTGNRPVMGETSSKKTEGMWLLSPTNNTIPDQRPEDCWAVSSPVGRRQGLVRTEFSPGQSEVVAAQLLADSTKFEGPCPNAGVYRFSRTYEIYRPSESEDEQGSTVQFDWGFNIQLKQNSPS